MSDLTFTRSSEFMVTQIEGRTEAGVEFVDAYIGVTMVVLDAGRIIVNDEAASMVRVDALARGLTIEHETLTHERAIIGHEGALAKGLTRLLLDAAKRRHDWKSPSQTLRGYTFDLELRDPSDKPTGIVARVTVEIMPRESKPMTS